MPDGVPELRFRHRLVTGLASVVLLVALAALALLGHLPTSGAMIVALVGLAGLVALHLAHRRELARLARFAQALAEGEEPAEDLAAAIARLHERFEHERGRVAGAASAADMMLDALPDPVVLLDAGRVVVRANAAAADVLGQRLVGQHLAMALRHPAILEAVDAALAGDGGSAGIEFQVAGKTARDFNARVVPLPAGAAGQFAAILTLHDLTALKRAEQMRVDFVANASHELRTPLATLVGFIETLQGPAKDDAEARERFLQIMADQAGRMARLIRDLLSLSQIELNEHTPPRGQVDLLALVRAVVDGAQLEAKGKEIDIRVVAPDTLKPVQGEADELTQIVQNLLDNAMKYGGPGKPVTLTLKGAGGGVMLSVRDQGPGIAREHLPRLTERFYRVDTARSRALGGTGLGLAIVKHIVNRHRGTLTIDSVVGEGTTFAVALPAAE